jgi:putative transposase
METHTLDQRRKFINALESGQWSMSELCARFGVSRPTGYKWQTRYRAGGLAALEDRSHAPQHCPHRVDGQREALIVAVRREYGWGAKKLRQVLTRRYPTSTWPARSTINDLLARHHLLRRQRRRRPWTHPGGAPLSTTRRIKCGPPTSKASSRPGMGATVIR